MHALLPVLERAAARAMYGSARDAVQLLAGAPEGRATGTPTALAEVQRSLMLLQLGEVEAARAAAAAAVDATQVVGVGASGGSGGDAAALAGVRSSAHTLMAAAALCRAAVEAEEGGGAGPEAAAARKKSLLEARWARARVGQSGLCQAASERGIWGHAGVFLRCTSHIHHQLEKVRRGAEEARRIGLHISSGTVGQL